MTASPIPAANPRRDGRAAHALRTVRIEPGYSRHAEGSALVEFGDTRVLCTVSVEDRVPAFLRGRGEGWLTAEYAMLPRATGSRSEREAVRGRQGGRTHEIQRLIGRSLRCALDLSRLGERTLQVDCDVLQADGGTRTASITGAWVAVEQALAWMRARGMLAADPVREAVAAVSVGLVDGEVLLDLDYSEDSRCDADVNVVMTSGGNIVEVQGTAEGLAFPRARLDAMIDLAGRGIESLVAAQRAALRAAHSGA
jgi:ribonuclease PH